MTYMHHITYMFYFGTPLHSRCQFLVRHFFFHIYIYICIHIYMYWFVPDTLPVRCQFLVLFLRIACISKVSCTVRESERANTRERARERTTKNERTSQRDRESKRQYEIVREGARNRDGVATISRMLKNTGLFAEYRSLL